jgi:hypothetical protein
MQELESFADESDDAAAAGESDAVDLDDFGMSGWGQFGAEEAAEERPAAKQTGRSKQAAAKVGCSSAVYQHNAEPHV